MADIKTKTTRGDIPLPPLLYGIEIVRPGNLANLFFPVQHVKSIRSHRSISAGAGGITLTIPYQDWYIVQDQEKEKSQVPLKLSEIKNGVSLRFGQIFPIYSFIRLYYENGSSSEGRSGFNKLNTGMVKTRASEFVADGKSFLQLTIVPPETKLMETEFFLDYQRESGKPPSRSQDDFAGVINSAADILLQGQLKDLITNFWNKFFCELLEVPAYGYHPFLAKTTDVGADSILSLVPPENAYTESFAYESQVLSSFTIGEFISFWDIFRSYLSAPLYELFVDPLQTTTIGDKANPGVIYGPLGASSQEIKTYSVGQGEAKVVFRPTPFYMFNSDGKYRDLSENGIDYGYVFALDDLKQCRFEDSPDAVVSAVHLSLNVYSSFGTVLSEPKYNNKLRAVIGPKFLSVRLSGLNFKEENLTEKNKAGYKDELSKIRDILFSIFCDNTELKCGSGSFSLPFIPIRVGMPFQIIKDDARTYPFQTDDISEFGYITDVIDEFSPGDAKANTTVHYKWAPTKMDAFSNL
ncbi:hypothetical protein EHO57_13870 [Leptospira langatensis]|uniref:Uncharacterized protein n=1 Tax=Leptospira langatensis TaxID=2484983 RepID=A0A5R2AT03_9LEPT|nr:hypothetical protein [Leptospira langatensis]TGJ99843.1 hypothetical protein EHO57_13870 [Leptospira langatensis]